MRCYDVEALMVSPNKPPKLQGIFKPETRRMVTPQEQAYPDLKKSTGTIGCRTITKPKIRLLGQAEGYLLNFLGLNEQGNAPASSCLQHGDFSPFKAFQRMQQVKEEEEISSFGLEHSTSSASKPCKRRKTGDSANALHQLIAHDLWSLQPFSVDFEREQWLEAQGLGFRHSSTSCFEVYDEAMMQSKGKAKANF